GVAVQEEVGGAVVGRGTESPVPPGHRRSGVVVPSLGGHTLGESVELRVPALEVAGREPAGQVQYFGDVGATIGCGADPTQQIEVERRVGAEVHHATSFRGASARSAFTRKTAGWRYRVPVTCATSPRSVISSGSAPSAWRADDDVAEHLGRLRYPVEADYGAISPVSAKKVIIATRV